jgi:hypothetical protein
MYYRYYPYSGWSSPWVPPMGMGYPMTGGWGYPYGDIGQMPYYLPLGGYGAPEMSYFGQPNYPPPWEFGDPGMSPYGPPMTGGFGTPGMPPYGPAMAPEQEIAFLRDQAQMLKEQIDQIDARIKELEKVAK